MTLPHLLCYKFTGKERDSESGLDNFGARYDASSLGRFMTPDPVGGHSEDPQTLNRYAYVRNNPLSLTDPTGLDFYLKCQNSDNLGCVQVQIDPNNAKSQTWVQADSNGNATVVTSDSILHRDASPSPSAWRQMFPVDRKSQPMIPAHDCSAFRVFAGTWQSPANL